MDDLTTGWEEAKLAGEAKAVANARAVWKNEAMRAALVVVYANEFFTTTTIYAQMDPSIRDISKGQAFTGTLNELVATGRAERTDTTRNEKQKRNHGRPQRVWRSRVFKGVK